MKASWAARRAKQAPELFTPAEPLRGQLLDRAKALTLGERNASYGDPFLNFDIIGRLKNNFWLAAGWTREGNRFEQNTPFGHAIDMVLTKLGRIASAPTREAALADDNFIDAIAYLAIAKEVAERS